MSRFAIQIDELRFLSISRRHRLVAGWGFNRASYTRHQHVRNSSHVNLLHGTRPGTRISEPSRGAPKLNNTFSSAARMLASLTLVYLNGILIYMQYYQGPEPVIKYFIYGVLIAEHKTIAVMWILGWVGIGRRRRRRQKMARAELEKILLVFNRPKFMLFAENAKVDWA